MPSAWTSPVVTCRPRPRPGACRGTPAIGAIIPAADVGVLARRTLSLRVNGGTRQSAPLTDLIWSVPDILHALSRLYALRAGDLVFMGTPAGVSALGVGDRFEARLDDVLSLSGHIAPPVA